MITGEKKQLLLHIGLFLVTLLTTTLAGVEWSLNKYLILGMTWEDFFMGFSFSIPFLTILTFHEFGHYFVARYYDIKVSLPYFIPLWFGFMLSPSIGTMGAFIRIKETIDSRIKYFDVGIAGPLAGFAIALPILYCGVTQLPEIDYIYRIHPEYSSYASIDEAIALLNQPSIVLGNTLLFDFFKSLSDQELLPNPHEMIHYPWILAGYLALFFTALNLLPIGQLDGGHILFGLLGARKHWIISRIFYLGLLFYSGLGILSVENLDNLSTESLSMYLLTVLLYLSFLYLCLYRVFVKKMDRFFVATLLLAGQFFLHLFTNFEGYYGWLFLAFIIGRFIGVDHPKTTDYRDIGIKRKILGWLSLLIFILCFSPKPLIIKNVEMTDTVREIGNSFSWV